MIKHEIVSGIYLSLLEKRNAEELFNFIEKGRRHFEDWIPFVSNVKTINDMKNKVSSYLEMYSKGEGYFWVLLNTNKAIVGLALIKDIDVKSKTAEIGYMIDEEYEGKGIIRKTCKMMIEFIFEDLRFNKVILCCDERNVRSIGIAKRFNFELEGILKQNISINDVLCNTMYWGLFRDKYRKQVIDPGRV